MKGVSAILKLAEHDMERSLRAEYNQICDSHGKGDVKLAKRAQAAAVAAVNKVLKGTQFKLNDRTIVDWNYDVEDLEKTRAFEVHNKRVAMLRLAFGQLERDLILASSSEEVKEFFAKFTAKLKG